MIEHILKDVVEKNGQRAAFVWLILTLLICTALNNATINTIVSIILMCGNNILY